MEINSARLDEWLERRMAEGEDATAETFIEEVLEKSDAYDAQDPPYDELAQLVEGGNAKVAELEEAIGSKDGEIAKLKSHNYDLLMSSGAAVDGDGVVEEVVTDDGEVMHIDNLFVDPDEKEAQNAD